MVCLVMGKIIFVLNIVEYVVIKLKKGVVVFLMEMLVL